MRHTTYIELRDLSIHSGRNILVRGISFTAGRGMVTGMVGESGSGKSLSCQAIMGLVPQELAVSGAICINGEVMPVAVMSGEGKRRSGNNGLAMIMQNPASCFNPVSTIGAHFKETLAAHNVPRSRNKAEAWCVALREVGFPEPQNILQLYPFQMSGGMLQRTMIALALVVEVDFLLADEATTDLDVVSQAKVLDLIEKLVRARGIGVLLVTHDLSVIARLADEVLVMQHGTIVERGDVKTIFHSPLHSYTKSLLQAHFRLYGMASGQAGRGASTISPTMDDHPMTSTTAMTEGAEV